MRLGMQRRGLTVLVGAVVIALLGIGVTLAPVPYVVLEPGPTYDTLGEQDGDEVITIGGAEPAKPSGELRLTTVSVQPNLTLVDAIRAWFDRERAVVPEELFFPPGQTPQEVEERNREQFTRSQSTAEFAAMRYLGYPVQVVVASVVEGGPADGELVPGDVVVEVDGAKVTEVTELAPLVTAHPVGTTLEVAYERAGELATAQLTTVPDADDPEVPRIGVVVEPVVDHPYDLRIELEKIGGPSAGLMFALGIVDKLEPEDLTGGAVIAGTGTIDVDGNVGAIGGVPQKLLAARDVGATAFLVPAANCPEAVATAPPGLVLIEVQTLAGAIEDLAALRTGGSPTTCGG